MLDQNSVVYLVLCAALLAATAGVLVGMGVVGRSTGKSSIMTVRVRRGGAVCLAAFSALAAWQVIRVVEQPVSARALAIEASTAREMRSTKFPADIAAMRRYLSAKPDAAQSKVAAASLPDVDTMISRLEERLRRSRNDGEGWRMLGWSYVYKQRYDKAVAAYKKAVELTPDSVALRTALRKVQEKSAQQIGLQKSSEVRSKDVTLQ